MGNDLLEAFRDAAIKCHIGFKHEGPWDKCEWIECEDRRKMADSALVQPPSPRSAKEQARQIIGNVNNYAEEHTGELSISAFGPLAERIASALTAAQQRGFELQRATDANTVCSHKYYDKGGGLEDDDPHSDEHPDYIRSAIDEALQEAADSIRAAKQQQTE